MLEELVLFLMCFVLVLIIYEIFVVKKAKKNADSKDKKYPVEVKLLIDKYNLDMKKINYNQLLQIVAIVSSFDIALIVSAVMIFEGYILQLIGSIVIVIPVVLVSYHLVGLFYKKKGMIKNGKHKRNWKKIAKILG